MSVFGEMRWIGMKPEQPDFLSALSALARGGQMEQALQMHEEMKKEGLHDSKSYSTTISACTEARQWEMSLHLLHETANNSVVPDNFLYNMVMSSCLRSEQPDQVEAVYDEMLKWGIVPDASSLTCAIKACTLGETRWQRALALFYERAENRRLLRDGKTRPSPWTYHAAMQVCGQAGQWEFLLELFDRRRRRSPRLTKVDHRMFIGGLASCGKWDLVLQEFYDAMPLCAGLFCYNQALEACARLSKWEEALAILGGMPDTGHAPNAPALAAMARACAAAGQAGKAGHFEAAAAGRRAEEAAEGPRAARPRRRGPVRFRA